MASVNPIRSRDRGQLILVTGLTIAVILVALVLLLNTVIYTENLATRGIDSGGGDAVEYRATVVGSVGELVERENDRYDGDNPPEAGIRVGIVEIDEFLRERYLHRGVIAEVEINEEGTPIVWQTDSGEFIDEPMMTGTNDIEQFDVTVDPDGFTEENEESFNIVVGDWSIEIDVSLEEENSNQINVTVDGDENSPYEYNYEEAPLEIDLFEGSIETNGESGSENIEPPSPDDAELRFENGHMVTGSFELQADGEPEEDNLTEYEGESGDEPYYVEPIESIEIRYETSEVRFITEVTIPAVEVEEEP